MRIGISALLFNIEEALNLCKKIENIKHIEIGIDNLDECEKLCDYKDRIKELDLSLGIHLPMELNTCENVDYIRNSWIEFVEKLYDNVKEIDIKYINLHLGYVMSNRLKKNRDKYLNISSDFLKVLSDRIDTNISIENVYSDNGDFSNVGNIAYDFEYIFERVKNRRLWFCYDTGHNLINKDNYIKQLSQKIKIIHLSDNDGINDKHIGIGKGILSKEHIKEVVNLDTNYMVLEINYKDIEDSIKNLDFIMKEV